MTQKTLIKMQISPIKNPNFEKPSRNLSNRTKVKILKKNFFGYLSKHRNSGENRRKRSEFFSKIYEGHIKIWFRSKKNSKLSHACVPLTLCIWHFFQSEYFKKLMGFCAQGSFTCKTGLCMPPAPRKARENPSLGKNQREIYKKVRWSVPK